MKTAALAPALAIVIGLLTLPAAARDTIAGVPMDGSFRAAERQATMLKIEDVGKPALAGIQRAAISSFQVQFVTKGAAGASSYEIGRPGRAGTNVVVTLVGVGAPDFQLLTDKLYNDFIADLLVMGIDVVPTEKVLAAPAYQKMAASGSPSPTDTRTKDTWSTVYAPAGLAVYGVGSTSTAVAIFAGFSAMSAAMSTMTGNQDLQKELDATLINVRLVVNFVDLKSSDSSWFGRSSGTATVGLQYSPSIVPAESFMTLHKPTVSGTLALNAPLLIDGSAFKEVKDTTSIAANIGLAVLSLAIGGGGSQTAIEKEVVAESEPYRAAVGAGLGGMREMFMARLRANR